MISFDIFVKLYKEKPTEQNKIDFIKSHITTNYVPYEKKIALCNSIVENTCVYEVDGIKEFRMNTPGRMMYFLLTLLNEYTDVSVDFSDCINIFNEMQKSLMSNDFLNCLPPCEYDRFNIILEQCLSDYMTNNRSIISFLENKVGSFVDILGMLYSFSEQDDGGELEENGDGENS